MLPQLVTSHSWLKYRLLSRSEGRIQDGIEQAAAGGVSIGEAGFQPVAEVHQFVYLGGFCRTPRKGTVCDTALRELWRPRNSKLVRETGKKRPIFTRLRLVYLFEG